MFTGRIMVVDDDQALLGFTTKYLTRLGYSVAGFRSSEEAWIEFSAPAANYALIVVDLSLPALPGEALAGRMLKANPDVRLIFTSGYLYEPKEFLSAYRDRITFLHKPFTPSMLTELIEQMI